jgi:hypothetical protein
VRDANAKKDDRIKTGSEGVTTCRETGCASWLVCL